MTNSFKWKFHKYLLVRLYGLVNNKLGSKISYVLNVKFNLELMNSFRFHCIDFPNGRQSFRFMNSVVVSHKPQFYIRWELRERT